MRRVIVGAVVMVALAAGAAGALADELKFGAHLSREQEVPVATGGDISEAEVEVRFNETLSEVEVKLSVEDGRGVRAAHFHCARAGENGPVAFGLFPGALDFDGEEAEGVLTTANANAKADCVATIGRPVNNIAALAFAMRDGLIYVNVHTGSNPPGEVRGQLLED